VECNPVRAHIVEQAEDYPWSSARVHCGLRDDPLLDSEWLSSGTIPDWSRWLNPGNEREMDQRIRDRTFTGRPCGDDAFVRKAEHLLGRVLAPQKPGPKPKPGPESDNSSPWTMDEIRF
jgi:putative transposase